MYYVKNRFYLVIRYLYLVNLLLEVSLESYCVMQLSFLHNFPTDIIEDTDDTKGQDDAHQRHKMRKVLTFGCLRPLLDFSHHLQNSFIILKQ